MEIIRNSTEIIKRHTCVALGNFDGVHLGHRNLILSAIECAKANDCLSCVYTFSSHPAEILGNGKKILTSTEEKVDIFTSLDCDIIYLEDFSRIRNMEPSDFCKNILKEKLNAKFVFCGNNYTFGYLGKGTADYLKKELSGLGISLVIVPYTFTENQKIVSSTYIRELISLGKISEASKLMNSHYKISGQVIYGKQLGRKLGFPTLNIRIPAEKVIPSYGVYASYCLLDGKMYHGLSNIGIRPTTDSGLETESMVNCETFLFEYSGNAYGSNITVFLCEKIRDEIHFGNIDELVNRISADVTIAKTLFSDNDYKKLCK